MDRDPLKALNFYRESAGIKDDLEYQDTVDRRIATIRDELQAQVAERDEQIAALEQQVAETAAAGQPAEWRGVGCRYPGGNTAAPGGEAS